MHAATETDVWEVLVIELFHSYDPDEEEWVRGFATRESACDYARARTWSSVEDLRKPGMTPEELKDQWWSFGEACSVSGEPRYSAAQEIDHFVGNAASAGQRDWTGLDPEMSEALLSLPRLPAQSPAL